MKAGSWQLFLYHVILSLTITDWTCVAADPSLAGSSPFPGNLVQSFCVARTKHVTQERAGEQNVFSPSIPEKQRSWFAA